MVAGFGNIANRDNTQAKAKIALNRASVSSASSHTHSNKTLLDSITQEDFDDITYCKNAIAGIATLLGITLNSDGTVASETYTAHTHNYDNNGTPDTTEGVN